MGTLFSTYDPFNPYGQYNLKEYAYKNKRNVIVVLSLILLLTVGAIMMIWATSEDKKGAGKVRYNIPPPRSGFGPFGTGIYLPPLHMVSAGIRSS